VKVVEHAFNADCTDIEKIITVMADELTWPRKGA